MTSQHFVNPDISPKFYFAALLVCAGGALLIIPEIRKFPSVSLTFPDVALGIFLFYLVVRSLGTSPFSWFQILPFLIFGITYVSARYIIAKKGLLLRASGLFAATGIVLSLHGLLPLAGFVLHGGSLPAIKGSFDNPAGYAAVLVILFPWCLYRVKNRWSLRSVEGFRNYLWLSASLLVAGAVCASGSRAGILGILLLTLLVFLPRIPLVRVLSVRLLMLVLLTAGILLAGGLYWMDQDSVHGRLLIWRGTFGLVGDHLLAGAGPQGFQAHYMEYQAEFFREYPASPLAILADNVRHPFNEPLMLLSGFGLIGVLLLGLLLVVLPRWSPESFIGERIPAFSGLAGILVFAQFSYPFRYVLVWLLAAWCLAVWVHGAKTALRVPAGAARSLATASVLLSLLLLPVLIRNARAEIEWAGVARRSLAGETQQMLPQYRQLMNTLQNNPHFLYNYGAELFEVSHYEQSLSVMLECSRGLNDHDVQMLLGRNLAALERVEEAEQAYLLASQMCPNRFAPLVGLMRLYASSGRDAEAARMARIILEKEVKVPSERVLMLIDEARRFQISPNTLLNPE